MNYFILLLDSEFDRILIFVKFELSFKKINHIKSDIAIYKEMDNQLDLDAVLSYLEKGKHLDEKCVTMLLVKLLEILYEERTLLTLHAPIIICGDIHGQLYDLFELLKTGGDPATNQYLFQGDYVDRGYFSLETYLYLVTLKLKFPQNIHLLRGNHESRSVSKIYGFYDEIVQNYGHAGIWQLCQETFDLLPIAAIIDKKIFSVHGGLSPDCQLVEQVELFDRQVELPLQGPLCDLTWSDPDDVGGWAVNQRGAGWLFGNVPTNTFVHNNKLSLITRAHQLVMAGYQYHFSEKVLTVWSAPNYGYVSGNVASVLKLDENLNRDIRVFKERPQSERTKPEDFVPHYFT